MPDGTPGELVMRADEPFAFATGYWRMPEKTVESWRNLWFHSGDRAVREPDGAFRFLDRMKDAIRRRGENISAWEVEQVLQSHPDVAAAAAIPVPSELGRGRGDGRRRPARRRDARLRVELIRHCEPRLAYFAVPRYLEVLDELPLTENGKVRKFVLRERGITPATWDREAAGVRRQAMTAPAAEPTAGAWLERLAAPATSRHVSWRSTAWPARRGGRPQRGRRVSTRMRVRAAADAADAAARGRRRAAPLLGLPVTIKDSLAVAGHARFCGSLAREDDRPVEDATVVARLRAAGAVVLAKTTVPEYMWSYETESAIHGRTRQPVRPGAHAGRLERGEAALIAAGASPLGIGTDGGGSIRVPSHYCGIVGLRPSARLVPETGCWPVDARDRDARHVDDRADGPVGRRRCARPAA